jgi:hypothetical protein
MTGMPHGVPIPTRGRGAHVDTSSLFDPSDYNADEVLAHLKDYPADSERVMKLERDGKARKSVLSNWETPEADPAIGDHLDNAAGIEPLAPRDDADD